MLSKEAYLKDPCRYASLPFYKLKNLKMPSHLQVIHEEEFKGDSVSEPYFRLIHFMDQLEDVHVPEGYSLETLDLGISKNLQALSDMISNSYDHERLPVFQMEAMIQADTFDKNLWIVVKKDSKIVASAISEFDPSLKEGVLEWIQVLPDYKHKGLGTLIVYASLLELSKKANFVTVSGRINNGDNPINLYKKCGFRGSDIWHVIEKSK